MAIASDCSYWGAKGPRAASAPFGCHRIGSDSGLMWQRDTRSRGACLMVGAL